MKIRFDKKFKKILILFCVFLLIFNILFIFSFQNRINDIYVDNRQTNSKNGQNKNLKVSDNPGNFTLSSDKYEVYINQVFNLTWTQSSQADNYSVHVSKNQISLGNEGTLIKTNITNLFYNTSNNVAGSYFYAVIAYNESGRTLSDNNVNILILAYPTPPIADSSDDSDKSSIIILSDFVLFLIVLIVIILIAVTLIVGYSVNHRYNDKMFTKRKAKVHDPKKMVLHKTKIKSSKGIIDTIANSQELYKSVEKEQFEQNIDLLKKLELTSISEASLKKIDELKWEDNYVKRQFILEMLALTPEERGEILNYMLKKSK